MADDAGYTFAEDEVRRIAKSVLRTERANRNHPVRRRRHVVNGPRWPVVAKTTSTITARSGDTPGSGTATYYELVSGTLTAMTADDLVDATVYNLSTASIDSLTYVQVSPPDHNGDRWVNMESC